jgi:preprotein translocase subunit SecY
MKHCPNPACPHFRAVGSPAEYVADLAACTDCGAALEDGPVPEESPREEAGTPPALRRLALTLLVIPVLFVLPWMSLPGLDVEAVRVQWMQLGRGASLRPPGSFGVFALGLSPLVSAGVLVGLGMLVVPRWRMLIEDEKGRRKLRRATAILTIGLALVQGYNIGRVLQGVPDVFNGSVLLTTLTLTAGAMVFVLAAELISRHGLGNGYSLLLFYGALGEEIDRAAQRVIAGDSGPLPAGALALMLGAPIVAVYVLGRVLHGHRGAEDPEHASTERPASYRLHATAPLEAGHAGPAPRTPFLRQPASGIVPLVVAGSVLAANEAGWWRFPGLYELSLSLRGNAGTVLHVAIILVVAVVLAFGLHPAERLARIWHPGGEVGHDAAVAAARAEVRRAAIRAAMLVTGVGALAYLARPALRFFPSASNLFVVTAVALDLLAEWRARRASGELATVATMHDLDAADAALAALRTAGIAAHARGAYHRAMLQIFGPYVTVDLMVAADRADAAAKIVEPFAGRDDDAEEEAAAPKRKKRRKKKAATDADQRAGETSRET